MKIVFYGIDFSQFSISQIKLRRFVTLNCTRQYMPRVSVKENTLPFQLFFSTVCSTLF